METQGQIETLLTETKRVGIENLIKYLQDNGFFESPASSKFHGCYKGGLAQHSLFVYQLLAEQTKDLKLEEETSPGQKPLPIKPENLVIACLLHDVCKIGAYIQNGDGYKYNKGQPKGHATLSIERVKQFIQLDPIEEMMIRYHMGPYGCNEFYKPDDYQQGEYPLRGDDSKPKEERYGKSLANAWYHNPITKLVYFCDEIATLREKQ